MILLKERQCLHPLVALICGSLWFFSGLFFVERDFFIIILFIMLFIFLCFGYRQSLLQVQLAALPVCILVTLLALITGPLDKAMANGARTYLLFCTATITMTIRPIALVRVLNHLRFPNLFTIGFLITLRFFSVIKEEMNRIRIAIKLRGIRHLAMKPSVFYRAFVIPLMIRIFTISDTMSMSLDTRGFAADSTRSIYQLPKITLKDYTFLLLTIVVNLGGFLGRYIGY